MNPSRPVLVLCEYASLNGGERSLLAVLDQPAFHGIDLRVASPDGALAEALRERGRPHLALPLHDGGGRRLPLDQCRSRLGQLISAVRPALIHANSLAMSRLSGPVAAGLGIPSLGHLRDILRVNRRVLGDLACHTRLLAVSQATRRWYVDPGLDPAKVHVLYNGVDLQTFCPRCPTGWLHRELHLPPHASLVGAIGQIGMRKGLDVFLAAAAEVAETIGDTHFLVVGCRYSRKQEAIDFEDRLLQAAHQPPLAGRCHFPGVREDIPRLLNELSLLVHAARQEPLGRVLLEAAAAGTATIATDVGGTGEIFPAGSSAAELVPVDDAVALAAAMARLLRDPGARQRLGQAARQRAEAAFDARHAASGLLNHYRHLCPALA